MFTPSPLFTDHAILPCDQEIRIFGQADEEESICARLTDSNGMLTGEGACTARAGRFLIILPPQRINAGPLTLTLSSKNGEYAASDLQVGYVFLAGGQSNMELALWNADEGQTLIRTHDDPDLRYFNVPRVSVLNDAAKEALAAARWQRIAPHQGGDMSAVAYFFARKVREETGCPVGVIGCNWGGTSIACWIDENTLRMSEAGQRILHGYELKAGHVTMEQWQAAENAFQADMTKWNGKVAQIKAENPGIQWSAVEAQAGKCPWNPPDGPGSPYRPGGLAQTMVQTLVPAALTGMLFYQGESDVERAEVYEQLLMILVLRWRELFRNEELPFYNVQLPMYIEDGAMDHGDWAHLRHAQEKVWRTLRNTYLAVMIDAGEYNNIHPTDKRTPGERLAQLFLNQRAGRDNPQPFALRKEADGRMLTVHVSQPLEVREGEADLFEIAGEDGVYHPAQAGVEDCCIRLTAPEAPHPVMARYAWVDWGKVHVFGKSGLPLAPFVLDQ